MLPIFEIFVVINEDDSQQCFHTNPQKSECVNIFCVNHFSHDNSSLKKAEQDTL